jgi:hypothetical protein
MISTAHRPVIMPVDRKYAVVHLLQADVMQITLLVELM